MEKQMKKIIDDLGRKNIRINKTDYSNMMLNKHYGEEYDIWYEYRYTVIYFTAKGVWKYSEWKSQ